MKFWQCSIVLFVMIVIFGINSCYGNAVRSSIDDEDRRDIANLAARILKIVVTGQDFYSNNKRNAGTVDSLYNLPDLLGVGRR
ncbi:hypothetical protein ACF0H5_018188 [Mactra antiquata]